MHILRYVSMLIVLVTFAESAPVLACSTVAGYLKPSNYELVRDTNAIVIAKAVRFRRGKEGSECDFEVTAVLKGDFALKTVTVKGHAHYFGASDPSDFLKARPGAYKGSCLAYDYKTGASFVLFLRQYKGHWAVSGPPFTRVNEEVKDADASWAKAVKLYAAVAALNDPAKEKLALKEILDRARKADNPRDYPAALVTDLEHHFASPHGSKTFDDLLELYKLAKTDEARTDVLWAFANGKHQSAKPFMHGMLKSGEWTKNARPIAQYLSAIGDKESIPILVDRFRTAESEDRWAIMWYLIETADDTHAEQMLSVLKAANVEESARLTMWFARHPSREGLERCRELLGGEYEKKWQLTIGLASMGDQETTHWALRFVRQPSENRWIALYVLARSPHQVADAAARRIIAGDDIEAVTALIQGYEESLVAHRVERLEEAMAKHQSNAEVRKWIRRSLNSLALAGDLKAKEALIRIGDKVE